MAESTRNSFQSIILDREDNSYTFRVPTYWLFLEFGANFLHKEIPKLLLFDPQKVVRMEYKSYNSFPSKLNRYQNDHFLE